ncbi:quinohemoprotein amine dehydrogenase subunit alpha [Azospirillum sp. TSH100]|uniref:quinohemoprotein amine dehydrogenase subunit alpha n=1 Tax=Azospirillum sp. TSH100 TaxID=652764 RepID=UPI001304F14E|nr:quinohemoprotein amine dehydrogenase subunit alpha [Azospirillum sp. TSH100]
MGVLLGAIAGGVVFGGAVATAKDGLAADGQALVEERCSACHQKEADGSLHRIDHVRKTPEGWTMTLFRMRQFHGVALSDEEQRTLVRHFADRQGLAPEESAPYRYVLERRPSVVEEPVNDGDLTVMCARCHSVARIGLQRRDADEWRRLVNFHLGQWPTIEYSAQGRDRKWWEIASTEIPQTLGGKFPFKTDAWTSWQAAPKPDLSGRWAVAGHRAGIGSYGGTATIAKADGGYRITYDLTDAAGKPLKGEGTSVVYTGYEWRGTGTLDGKPVREVLAASRDGGRLDGRWFLTRQDEVGGTLHAVRVGGNDSRILGASQSFLKAGTSARITLWGSGLDRGEVGFGPGVSAKILSRGPTSVTVEATATVDATPGARSLTVGKAKSDGFAVYTKLDSVRVEPDFTIARVGGNGGAVPPMTAQFEAVGYLNGPDGKPGTEDDVRVGPMPASWSVEPFNDAAAQMEDVKFAGTMGRNGLFSPTGAGPNPQRQFGTNNIGDLKVVGTVVDGSTTLTGTGRLISTVQRWNDPPIH